MSGVTPLIVVRRRRPLPLTSVLPQTIADMPVICGRRRKARASSSVSGRTEVGMPVGAGPEVLTLPGEIADQIGAELGELGEHETVDALADRREQDHRGDADGDAEQRQKAAQAGAR